jgi:hypothetical protein
MNKAPLEVGGVVTALYFKEATDSKTAIVKHLKSHDWAETAASHRLGWACGHNLEV